MKRRFRPVLWTFLLLAALIIAVPQAQTAQAALGKPLSTAVQAKKKNGLVKEKGKWRYYKKGKLVKKAWKKVKGKKYYFDKKGNAVTGSVKIGKIYYVFDAKCRLLAPKTTKAIKVNKVWYQVAKSGKAVSGWDADGVYCFGKNGAQIKNGWSLDKKSYLNGKGKKTTGVTVIVSVKKDEFGNEEETPVFYAFDKTGVYDKALSKQIRQTAVEGAKMEDVKALIGAPKKIEFDETQQCDPPNKHYTWRYATFLIDVTKTPAGEELFNTLDVE